MLCPAQLYQKSTRKMPTAIPPLRYPPGWLSRRVKGKGMINLNGERRFIGEAFEGERIGLKRTPTGWSIHFGDLLIGTLAADDHAGIHAVCYRTRTKS